MIEINERIKKISSCKEHYLVKAMESKCNYFYEFLEAEKILKVIFKPSEYEYWCSKKMLLKKEPFLEKTFIQYAVETSVVRYFAEKQKQNFMIEPKIKPNSGKDVDCQFSNNNFTYNVEVKCLNFCANDEVDKKDGFKAGTVGRIPDWQKNIAKVSSLLEKASTQKGEPPKPTFISKNMDNNLKDFLEPAHEKFNPVSRDNEVNILVVGCDDANDMQRWGHYLFANQGLFTRQSFADPNNYKNIDVVVLTNLYFKHNKYYTKRVRDSWSLFNSLSLVFSNPFRIRKKEDAIMNFLNFCPHYTWQLKDYTVPGDILMEVENALRISHFVKDYLENSKGIYLFEDKAAQ